MFNDKRKKKEVWRKLLVFFSSSSSSSGLFLVYEGVDRMFNGHTCQRAQSILLTCDKTKMKVKLKIINGKNGFKTF
jgi:hypothetical protein